jgi:3-oxoacyl-[acyl-carrier-protein] synthase-3
VVTNADLEKMMDTTDEWIRQRTGIEERRWISEPTGASDLAVPASRAALEMAGIDVKDVDAIIFASLSPDYHFPGSACLLNDKLGIPGVASIDIRNQCSGFVYGVQLADAYIRSGLYRNVLFVGAEVHSTGLDISTRGRDVSVIFGDGAGAVLFTAEDGERGVLATDVGADGRYAKELWVELPASREMPRLTEAMMAEGRHFPRMNGREVFKHAVRKMPETIAKTLDAAGLGIGDIDLFIPHQANLRIAEALQKTLQLPEEKMYNNIQRLGNTTAASIPIALDECVRSGRTEAGDVFVCSAFGAGFTWGSAVIRL